MASMLISHEDREHQARSSFLEICLVLEPWFIVHPVYPPFVQKDHCVAVRKVMLVFRCLAVLAWYIILR